MTPSSRQQEQNQFIIESLAAIQHAAEGSIAFQARMEEKMANFDVKLDRVDKAVYGNGKPGIQEQLNICSKRLEEIEIAERACPINDIAALVKDMSERHTKEDEIVEESKEDEKKKKDELRKFRYGIISAIVMLALDIVTRALGIIK